MKEIIAEAKIENVTKVTEFVDKELSALNCPKKAQMEIDVAIDEIFSNIANYAYHPEIGQASVQIDVKEEPLSVEITFIDSGKPYNPLDSKDPHIDKSVEEREIGGLGIFIVKKSMDAIEYEFKDGKNILKIKKNI